MAYHDISSRFRIFTTAASSQAVAPQADFSPVASDAKPSGTDWEANPREPEWQGQWRLLKYL
jgi:hypothetical protein